MHLFEFTSAFIVLFINRHVFLNLFLHSFIYLMMIQFVCFFVLRSHPLLLSSRKCQYVEECVEASVDGSVPMKATDLSCCPHNH